MKEAPTVHVPPTAAEDGRLMLANIVSGIQQVNQTHAEIETQDGRIAKR